MTTVLVTGGAGYVGSHACKALAAAGYVPVTYDTLEEGYRWAVQWGPLEEGDVADAARLDEVFARHRPEAVLHFAGYIAAGESVEAPLKYFRNNVAGTLNLLEAMRRAEVGRIVFSSTAAVYGEPQSPLLSEDHPLRPVNPYGQSKLMAEAMLRDAARAHGMKVAALRYFNAAGADPQARIGEAHEPETHLIPLVLDAAAGRRGDIRIFGDDYDTPDGTGIRDYIHVDDLAEAHVLALQALDGATEPLSLNLGNGTGFSVLEVVDVARRVTGREIPAVVAPRRSGDPARLVADCTAAKRLLDWRQKRGELETIVADAWRWHVRHFGDGV
ncbi:MAG: UDP-glucose 4-epimerase GalE [Rhodovibrionaceae bacterium]|nr:UDP-glucose 4-epimerase GalE [Rhodovibrionaceae bacterium]